MNIDYGINLPNRSINVYVVQYCEGGNLICINDYVTLDKYIELHSLFRVLHRINAHWQQHILYQRKDY